MVIYFYFFEFFTFNEIISNLFSHFSKFHSNLTPSKVEKTLSSLSNPSISNNWICPTSMILDFVRISIFEIKEILASALSLSPVSNKIWVKNK